MYATGRQQALFTTKKLYTATVSYSTIYITDSSILSAFWFDTYLTIRFCGVCMRCLRKAENGTEMSYYRQRQGAEGSVFSNFLHGAGFPPGAHYSS